MPQVWLLSKGRLQLETNGLAFTVTGSWGSEVRPSSIDRVEEADVARPPHATD
jgi:hypothetical protein